ncbi:unnamed protein product [Effrenium voratum]|nr:unnamed protein product [Effrenium voratum]
MIRVGLHGINLASRKGPMFYALTYRELLLARRAEPEVSPEELPRDIEVWDQSSEELSLDTRELLITDANIYVVGPDMDSYREDIQAVADRLNYTLRDFNYTDMPTASELTGMLEKVIVIPPLTSVTRFPWKLAVHGLVVWIDPDGWERRDVVQKDKVRKRKFPRKKAIFGPEKPVDFSLHKPKNIDAADPIDMWQEADVHVDLQARPERSVADLIMASIIDAILRSPPKWRSWMKAGKVRGTIPSDYETPHQVRREFHSYGISPRLNKLLKA